MSFDTRIAIVLDEGLAVWQKANVTAAFGIHTRADDVVEAIEHYARGGARPGSPRSG